MFRHKMAKVRQTSNVVVTVLYVLFCCVHCHGDKEKRILLSDPEYVQQQMTHLQSELQILQATVQAQNVKLQTQDGKISSLEQQLSHANQDRGGATFVRWGRTDCPANLTDLVYSGYAGGSWWDHPGAAAEYVCLPRDPDLRPLQNLPNEDYSALIYGAEYESNNGYTPFGPNSHNKEVPCAVCRPKSFVSSLMIPAKTTCYNGWTKAYSGSLAAGNYAHKAASQYVCVDGQAQDLDGGGDINHDGKLFFAVRAQCGSLRCPPYEQNKYLSCVVCLK